jgi:endonuclease/exonuclease/phosphatase family metal-dependent hydrolase
MQTALSLISWNLHGVPFVTARRDRFRRVAAQVLDRGPDVVLFQEVWLRRDAGQLTRDLVGHYMPVPARTGRLPLRASGLLSFIRHNSPWRLRSSHLHRFAAKAPFWKFWEGDGLGRKGVQQMHLEHDRAGVLLLNTHLQATYRWNNYERIRRPQLAQLTDLTARLDHRWPVIASGDLNTRPHEHLFHELLAHWHDLTHARRRHSGAGTHLDGSVQGGGWIDYILARRHATWKVHAEDVRLIESTTPDVPYSDHQGLHAHIHLHRMEAEPPALERAPVQPEFSGQTRNHKPETRNR